MHVEPQVEIESSRRLHPFFRDLSVSLAAQVGVALSGLLLYRLLAIHQGTNGFASYSLVKQAAAFLFPVVTIGCLTGLPRYLALPREEGDPAPAGYALAAALLMGGATAIVAVLALVLREPTAELLFGGSEREELVPALAALMSAVTLFYVGHGYYRGLLRLRVAALLQVVGFALIPPIAVLALPDASIDELILVIAAVTAAIALAVVARPLLTGLLYPRRSGVPAALRSLWSYGPRRVPGEAAQLAMMVLTPILVAHVGSLRDVAYITAGQAVLGMLSLAVIPLGLILLPTLTKLWEEDRERASEYVGELAAFSCHVALFASLQTVIFADVAVRLWLGEGFDDATALVRVTVAPAAQYVVYIMLKATLDAVAVKAYNSRNSLIGFAVLAVLAALFLELDVARPAMCVAWAFAAALSTVGVLTFLTVHRHFGVARAGYALPLVLPLTVLTGAVALAARPLIEDGPAPLVLLGVAELILGAAFFGTLFRRGVGWTKLLASRLFQHG